MFLTILEAILAARFAEWLIVAAVKTWYAPIVSLIMHIKNYKR